jgi:hypothetical protein
LLYEQGLFLARRAYGLLCNVQETAICPAVSWRGAWQATSAREDTKQCSNQQYREKHPSLLPLLSLFLIINKNKGLPFRKRCRHLLSGRGDNPLNRSPRYPHELPSLFLSQAVTITKPEGFKLITMQFYPLKLA